MRTRWCRLIIAGNSVSGSFMARRRASVLSGLWLQPGPGGQGGSSVTTMLPCAVIIIVAAKTGKGTAVPRSAAPSSSSPTFGDEQLKIA
jgi:hypothetical protein